MVPIPSTVQSLGKAIQDGANACAFAPRCSQPIDVCVEKTPEFVEDGPRALRCHNPVEVSR